MDNIHFSYSDAIDEKQFLAFEDAAIRANTTLQNGNGKGNDFLGWLDLPSKMTSYLNDIENSAKQLQQISDVIVCIGIGGSYLGAKATIEALTPFFNKQHPQIIFAGHNISEDYLYELTHFLKNKSFSIICISKSGTTTEPAIAFRILKKQLEAQFGEKESQNRIVCITDAKKGALKTLANEKKYKTYVIDDNVGGRFSVLSPVGLLPIACASINIREFINGAKYMQNYCKITPTLQNECVHYAITRNALYKNGKKIEILVNFNPKLQYIAEWWKQLYGESEGKEHKGIFPASVSFTTDLHSMGQYIQEGERHLMETFISVEKNAHELFVPEEENNLDQLNFLAGKRLKYINEMAEKGTTLAHIDGGIPIMHVVLPNISPYYLGELFYFYEYACAVSGYILDVNPFNQPGVEAYKKNMFALLNKPGYEEQNSQLLKKLQS